MRTPRLYDFELDDDCYMARLALGLMGTAYEKRPVDMVPGREHEAAAMRALNPLGRLPVLVIGDVVLRDPQAIALHVARFLATDRNWLPGDPVLSAEVANWLAFSCRDLQPVRAARREALFSDGLPSPDRVAAARAALVLMEDHMVHRGFAGATWFVGQTPTLADVVLFPAFALSRDIGLDHDAFPALRRWSRRVRALPGFVAMPGIPDYF